ncbi:SDR family NAD(P)-dependent oxidoreductase [Mycolicibacterium baixiangningiae]|uniref:SDR family NAD(P)-dependent oxidoreductase n=1 Tax=Mycolicibacterium baixiangningiae TaxID=2761578 RepID=UPI001865FB9A|nr:SDR family NAD(P)-dependent oxidoreductase [Mycolicibacterium baixiangningiae]
MTSAGALIVVGAGPSVGAATARRFAAEGYPVGLIARDPDRLSDLGHSLSADRVTVATAAADVTDTSALEGALVEIADQLGDVDTMLFSPRPSLEWIKPVLETTGEDVAAALALNVVAAANAVRAVVGPMIARGTGTLLFTTGGAVLEPHRDRAVSGIAYAAESVWVRMLHDALAPKGVLAAQLTIVGGIGPDQRHHPAVVAEQLWQLRTDRDRQLMILR